MSLHIFLSIKFMLETAALCWLLSYTVTGETGRSFKAVLRRSYLFLVSGFLQDIIYALLGNSFFSVVYVFWNLAVLWIFWWIEIRREMHFSGVWVTYSVILFQLCQLFVTYLIYALPGLAERIADFGRWESLISTLLIWLICAATAAISCAKLPDLHTLSARETLWAHIFFWFSFGAECLIFRTFTEDQKASVLSVFIFVLLYIDIQLYYFSFMQSISERNEKIEQIQIKQQYAAQLEHYEQINLLYRKLREVKHDANNRLVYIEQMLQDEQYDALKQFFKSTKAELSPVLEMPDYGNRLINAILWSKGDAAKREGISMDIHAAVPEDIPIEGYHLCSLLGNLLDNAIEASRSIEHPYIHVTMRMKESYLYCCVCNRVNTDALRDNPNLNTTKPDAQNHGYGIRAIKKIAEQYQGMTNFTVQNGEFVASVMLLCRKAAD